MPIELIESWLVNVGHATTWIELDCRTPAQYHFSYGNAYELEK